MAERKTTWTKANKNSAAVKYEQQLAYPRRPADSMDRAEYKHVVLGLIFVNTFWTAKPS